MSRRPPSRAWHAAGAAMLWGGVPLFAVAVLVLPSRGPGLAVAAAAGALGVSAAGAVLKKRHCPRCAGGACRTAARRAAGAPPSS